MTTAKNAVFIGLKLETCCLVGGNKNLVEGGREIFLSGGMSKFFDVRDSPHRPPVGKTLLCSFHSCISTFQKPKAYINPF